MATLTSVSFAEDRRYVLTRFIIDLAFVEFQYLANLIRKVNGLKPGHFILVFEVRKLELADC